MSKYPIFDGHCDTATELWRRNQSLDRTDCMVSLPDAKELGGYGQFFAFCTYGGLDLGYSCEDLLYRPYAYFMEELARQKERIVLCRTMADLDAAAEQRKAGAFLALEGAEGIQCDPGRLDELYNMGIRMVTLTWNANNALAGSAKEDGPGLSRQGREFVRKAQGLGIMVDVSHISDRAFWDIMDIAERPVVASHSNSRRLCGHGRNLTDEQFLALCQLNGSAGLNLYSYFLAEDGNADLETVYRHLDHFLTLSGGGHVALGGDLDGCDSLPKGFRSLRDHMKLTDLLEEKEFSPEMILEITSKTLKKVVTLCTT